MKTSTLLSTILFIFLHNSSEAQLIENITTPAYKNEIGLTLFSYQHKDKRSSNSSLDPFFVSGVHYKRHFGKNRIRVGFEGLNKHTTSSISSSELLFESYEARLGYERAIPIKMFEIYFALDAAFLRQITHHTGTVNGNAFRNVSTLNAIGLVPAAGLRYRISKKISINAETCFNSYMVSYKVKYSFSPLKALSINYHF